MDRRLRRRHQLLTYHDIPPTTSTSCARTTAAQSTPDRPAIPATNYKAQNNELGNIVIDHNHPTPGGFWAYQSFVAPSRPGPRQRPYDEAFLAVSNNGGTTWVDKPIPCTQFGANGLEHNFPNVSVAPNGTLYYAVSNDTSIYVAESTDHGNTWTCSGAVSTSARRSSRGSSPPAQVRTSSTTAAAPAAARPGTSTSRRTRRKRSSGWTTKRLMPVHQGPVCEGGVSCTGGRQLLDDFAIDTDHRLGTHRLLPRPADLGGSGSYTGYAVQKVGIADRRPQLAAGQVRTHWRRPARAPRSRRRSRCADPVTGLLQQRDGLRSEPGGRYEDEVAV